MRVLELVYVGKAEGLKTIDENSLNPPHIQTKQRKVCNKYEK